MMRIKLDYSDSTLAVFGDYWRGMSFSGSRWSVSGSPPSLLSSYISFRGISNHYKG